MAWIFVKGWRGNHAELTILEIHGNPQDRRSMRYGVQSLSRGVWRSRRH